MTVIDSGKDKLKSIVEKIFGSGEEPIIKDRRMQTWHKHEPNERELREEKERLKREEEDRRIREYKHRNKNLPPEVRRVKAVAEGIVGLGHRRPVEEAVISLVAKGVVAAKRYAKEKKEEREIRKQREYELAVARASRPEYISPFYPTHQRKVVMKAPRIKHISPSDMGMSLGGTGDPVGNVFGTPIRRKKAKKTSSSDPLGLRGFY